MNKNKIVAGIDYSFTCPSICFHKGDVWDFDNCDIYFLSQTKKYEGTFGNIKGIPYPFNYSCDEERYEKISNIFIDLIEKYNPELLSIEGYSFGSKGSLMFNIAENGGLLKNKLYLKGLNVLKPSPSEIKKFASTKGNSNKDIMYEYFCEDTKKSVSLKEKMCYNKTNIASPIGDIVDSYFICKYSFSKLFQ